VAAFQRPLAFAVLLPERFRGGCAFGAGGYAPASPARVEAITAGAARESQPWPPLDCQTKGSRDILRACAAIAVIIARFARIELSAGQAHHAGESGSGHGVAREPGGETMTTLTLPWVSAFTAGVLIILQMVLMLAAALNRQRARVTMGDNGDQDLLRRVRRHGNLAENAAIFIAAFTLLELLGEPRLHMEIACGVFIVARLLHVVGFTLRNTVNLFRVSGVILTFATGLFVGEQLIQYAVMHLCGAM
jgi:uncharacterized membrane protein YecN with MAPEG domain